MPDHGGALLGSLVHEHGLVGVVDEVVEQVVAVHGLVGQVGAFVGVGEHSAGGEVHDDIVFPYVVACDLVILHRAGTLVATHKNAFQT